MKLLKSGFSLPIRLVTHVAIVLRTLHSQQKSREGLGDNRFLDRRMLYARNKPLGSVILSGLILWQAVSDG